jgi:hypothetical protein
VMPRLRTPCFVPQPPEFLAQYGYSLKIYWVIAALNMGLPCRVLLSRSTA